MKKFYRKWCNARPSRNIMWFWVAWLVRLCTTEIPQSHNQETCHMTVTWHTHDGHMTHAWQSHDIHMTHTWRSHDTTWRSHDAHMMVTWWSHDGHMTYTWRSHDRPMTVTWHTYDRHMTAHDSGTNKAHGGHKIWQYRKLKYWICFYDIMPA